MGIIPAPLHVAVLVSGRGQSSAFLYFSIPLSGAGFVVSADGRVFIANRIKVVLKEDENYRISDKARGLFVASAYPVR